MEDMKKEDLKDLIDVVKALEQAAASSGKKMTSAYPSP